MLAWIQANRPDVTIRRRNGHAYRARDAFLGKLNLMRLRLYVRKLKLVASRCAGDYTILIDDSNPKSLYFPRQREVTAVRLHGPDEPVYTISVVARLLGVSTQTLRLFEREGLVEPARTEANIRLYSQNELVLLRRVCELVREEGVNIAGVRTVLRIERRYEAILGPVDYERPVQQAPQRPDAERRRLPDQRGSGGMEDDRNAVTGGEKRGSGAGAGPGGTGRRPGGF
jgi:DNA-binding transcriptional MerR regulator